MSRIALSRRSGVVLAALTVASVALVGGAAAVGSLTSSDGSIRGCVAKSNGAIRIIAPGARCHVKSERTLTWSRRGQRGLDGPRGPEGARGPEGSAGLSGPQGAPAASMLTGRLANLNQVDPDDDAQRFGAPSGLTAAPAGSAGNIATLSPAAPTVAQDLSAHFTGDVGDGTVEVALWVGGSPSALTCTISAASADGICTDTAHTVSIPPSTPLTIEANEETVGKNTIITSGSILFGWRATTP